MTNARRKVTRSRERLLQDCESHLKFLSEALAAYQTDPDRYKQVAGELRILVCAQGRNKPLLLDLMDCFGLEYYIHPDPTFPFPRPCLMVGDIQDPPEDMSGQSAEEILERNRANVRPILLREYVDRALAVYIAPHEYSYRDLILTVAQQIGGAHEDTAIDESLLQLEYFIIGGYSGYGAPLRHVGSQVLEAGRYLIRQAAEKYGYRPHHFRER